MPVVVGLFEVVILEATGTMFLTLGSKQQQEECKDHAWPVVGVEHRETCCTTTEVCVKEILAVAVCRPLRSEQCFHEVINLDPDIC